jgi:Na+-translocating ferredoxin:NAD+ oxidoreductase RNF subunit RnfB
MFQVRFHGRGGQGVVTAAELLAEAALGSPARWPKATPRRRAAFDFVATNGRRSPMLKQIGVCPDNAIIKLADGQYVVDYDHCTGCGLCAAECPCGAIDMEPEQT